MAVSGRVHFVVNAEVGNFAQPAGVDQNVGWLDVSLQKKKKKLGTKTYNTKKMKTKKKQKERLWVTRAVEILNTQYAQGCMLMLIIEPIFLQPPFLTYI